MSAHPRRVPDRKLQSYSMSREQAEEDLLHGNVRADAAGAGGVVGVVPAAGVGAGVRRAAACHDRGGLAPRCWVITPMLLSYNFVVQYKQNKEGEFKKEQASNIEKFKPPRKKIVKLDKVEDTKAGNHKISSSKTKEVPKMVKVKMEKAEVNKAEWLKAASNRKAEVIENGMEVALSSPNSLALAAIGTVQNTDEHSLASDGKPLSNYVEVLVNYVMNETTKLPRAHGRMKTMRTATAKCIPWPRIHINLVTESDLACQRIWKSIDQHLIPENLRSPRSVAEWRRTGIIPEMKKRKINDNDATSTDGANANSQAAQC